MENTHRSHGPWSLVEKPHVNADTCPPCTKVCLCHPLVLKLSPKDVLECHFLLLLISSSIKVVDRTRSISFIICPLS